VSIAATNRPARSAHGPDAIQRRTDTPAGRSTTAALAFSQALRAKAEAAAGAHGTSAGRPSSVARTRTAPVKPTAADAVAGEAPATSTAAAQDGATASKAQSAATPDLAAGQVQDGAETLSMLDADGLETTSRSGKGAAVETADTPPGLAAIVSREIAADADDSTDASPGSTPTSKRDDAKPTVVLGIGASSSDTTPISPGSQDGGSAEIGSVGDNTAVAMPATAHQMATSDPAGRADLAVMVPASSDLSQGDQSSASGATATGAADQPGNATAGGVSADQLKDWLAEPIVQLVSSSRREMAIQLRPPELGELTVRVAVNGRDVSAWFETAQPQVQQALTQALPQLHTDLGNAGYALTGAWVGADASGGSQQPALAASPQPRAETRGRGVLAEPTPARRGAIATASGVSIYV
jgi:flagellar hook-length control protein FliK